MGQDLDCVLQFTTVCQKLAAGQQAVNLAEQADGSGRDAQGFLAAGVGIAHFREEQSKLPLLQLTGAVLGQVLVQVLAGTAKGLPRRRRFLTQARPVRSADLVQ